MKTQPSDIDIAVDWLVKLQRPTVTPDDWMAFERWLSASDSHAKAYDQALALDLQLARHEPDDERESLASPIPSQPRQHQRPWLWPTAITMAVSLVMGWVVFQQIHLNHTPDQLYSTGRGVQKTVILSDGTRMALNSASHLSVRFDPRRRHVQMTDSEAYFDVAKDPRRPFIIDAGNTQIRVVGTAFDVKSRDGQVLVSVERGIVDVQPTKALMGRHYRLTPGQELSYAPERGSVRLARVETGNTGSWRSGRLIYRDQPLSTVVADLNRQFERPITFGDSKAETLRLTGVLIVDRQAAMLDRLSAMLPLKASDKGNVIVLETR